jgi:hypothetical protein
MIKGVYFLIFKQSDNPHEMSECAVGSDSQLLDASEIVFYHDADDTVPISAPDRALTAASSRSSIPSTMPTTLDTFFAPKRLPAVKTAGARRSQRVPRPSAKVKDPNNAISTARKCKRVHHFVVSSASEGDTEDTTRSASHPEDTELDMDGDEDPGAAEEEEDDDTGDVDMDGDEDADTAYQHTKALGD